MRQHKVELLPLRVLAVVAAFLLASPTGVLEADTPPAAKVQKVTIPPGSLNPCGPGWHVKPGTYSVWHGSPTFTCEPNKPSPKIKCGPSAQYFEGPCGFGCVAIPY